MLQRSIDRRRSNIDSLSVHIEHRSNAVTAECRPPDPNDLTADVLIDLRFLLRHVRTPADAVHRERFAGLVAGVLDSQQQSAHDLIFDGVDAVNVERRFFDASQ